jgi:hypothetical protein
MDIQLMAAGSVSQRKEKDLVVLIVDEDVTAAISAIDDVVRQIDDLDAR